LSHPDGLRLLQGFLAWAIDIHATDDQDLDIGACVSDLCGKYPSEMLGLLLNLMRGGEQAHVNVVASVLHSAHQEFVVEETPFILELLNQAELISDQAVRDISSALWSASVSGGRSGVVGEPFEEDVALRTHAEQVLSGLGKLDPAYRLYVDLLQHAKENIDRQTRRKQAMEEEDA
jgi:hypothetical protein